MTKAVFGMLTTTMCVLTIATIGNAQRKIEGVYEFLSEEITITKVAGIRRTPAERQILTSAEWPGLWQLGKGYFSSTSMKKNRGRLIECEKGIGFESFAGTYEATKDKITFVQTYSLNPMFKGRPWVVTYIFKRGILTLYKNLYPTVEDTREGRIVIRLKKKV